MVHIMLHGALTPFRHTSRAARSWRMCRRAAGLLILATLGSAALSTEDPFAIQRPTTVAMTAPVLGWSRTETYADISVLTYNVKGLPWPLRMDLGEQDAGAAMAAIGRHLGELRERHAAPHVVLIQEGFPDETALIGIYGGYRYAARGPTRIDAGAAPVTAADAALAREASWRRGETQGPVLDSGLYVFSDYPITVVANQAFGRHACAGYDCLAAKGVLAFTVAIPGVPEPVTLFTVHMNADGASGAPGPLALAAHTLQMDRLGEVLETAVDPALPLIFGGDFNVKAAAGRQRHADRRLGRLGLVSVHGACVQLGPACEPGYRAALGAHWLEPRDVQGFRSGARIRVRPLASAEMFAGPATGGKLSDHVGYAARYRLSWSAPGPRVAAY